MSKNSENKEPHVYLEDILSNFNKLREVNSKLSTIVSFEARVDSLLEDMDTTRKAYFEEFDLDSIRHYYSQQNLYFVLFCTQFR